MKVKMPPKDPDDIDAILDDAIAEKEARTSSNPAYEAQAAKERAEDEARHWTPPTIDLADFDAWRKTSPDAPAGTVEEYTDYLTTKHPNMQPNWYAYFATKAATEHADIKAKPDDENEDEDTDSSPAKGEVIPELEQLLDDLTAYYERFVAFGSPLQAKALALWAMYTHCFPLDKTFDVVPYLMVTSAEPLSGKSTVLDITEVVVHEPMLSADASAALIGRNCGGKTLLLDEVDAIYGTGRHDGDSSAKADDFKTILNNGYKRNGTYDRLIPGGKGKDYDTKSWSVYGPKVLAGIGRTVPDTVQSRSIRVRLDRKEHGDAREKPRRTVFAKPAARLKRRMAEMAATLGPLHQVEDMPESLGYRDIDIWEPLVALAERAGERWAADARTAAVYLTYREPVMSVGVQLLHDIRIIFKSKNNPEHIPTMDLIGKPFQRYDFPYEATGLCAIETSSWAVYSRGKEINPTALAKLLSEYNIAPDRIHVTKDSYGPKGYFFASFASAWKRYLYDAPTSAATEEPATPTNVPEGAPVSVSDEMADIFDKD